MLKLGVPEGSKGRDTSCFHTVGARLMSRGFLVLIATPGEHGKH